jgi:hypothetical protein
MLTLEQMNQITKEVTLGMPPSVDTPEATAFREQITKEVAAITRKGRIVELPAE